MLFSSTLRPFMPNRQRSTSWPERFLTCKVNRLRLRSKHLMSEQGFSKSNTTWKRERFSISRTL